MSKVLSGRRVWVGCVLLALAATAAAQAARAGQQAAFTLTTVISGTALSHQVGAGTQPLSQPDDLSSLHGELYVVFQNGVGPDGTPNATTGNADSTVVGFTPSGRVAGQWDVAGHADGLIADPAHDRLIVTVNEDANSSLYSIDLGAPAGSQLTHYSYSPSPLAHGGGTDSVVYFHGQLLVSASSPTVADGPALFVATLSGTTASLQPVFDD